VPDPSTREMMIQMMKDEFRPFRLAKQSNQVLKYEAVEYNLAIIRQRIN
jgi:hypothetical protein